MSNNQQRLPIAEASTKQLRKFAENYLGMTIPGNAKPETVMAKITSAWPKDYVFVPAEGNDEAAPLEGQPPPPITPEQQPPEQEMVRVHISMTEDKGGNEDVPVSVNGKAMLIPRGKDIDIPMPYFVVLNNAIVYRYDTDQNGNIIPEPRKIKAYPFQRVA